MAISSSLFVGNWEVHNVFHLVGDDEDSISLAIAWGLTNVPAFLLLFLNRVGGSAGDHADVQIRVHRYESGAGITDIEIVVPGDVHIIIEAKRGWVLPGSAQLALYAGRQSFLTSTARVKKIVALSECSQPYAKAHLPIKAIGTIPVEHVGWRGLLADIRSAETSSGHAEKRLLRDLAGYLRFVMTKQRKDSNLVYVVSLAGHTEAGWTTSWIEIVTKHSRYFHPVGGKWPKDPPNYMGFRYGGRLQSIHHVDEYEVIENLSSACPGIPHLPVDPHLPLQARPRDRAGSRGQERERLSERQSMVCH